jgi:hypothetical protein
MGQTMDHSTSTHSPAQKMPQGKQNAGKGTEKKVKVSEAASTRATGINVGARSIMAKSTTKISPEERQRMIEEAAYLRAEQRGFCGGNEMQDWLDAESEINMKFPG